MKNMFNKMLNDNRGMTLIELMVGMMIFAVITTSALSIFMPMMKIMMRSTEISEYNTQFDNVANLVINDLSSSTGPAVVNRSAPGQPLVRLLIEIDYPGAVVYEYDANGILLRNGIPLLPERFFGWTSVVLECINIFEDDDDIDAIVYHLSVSLLGINDDTGVSRTYVVRPLALNQYN